MNKRATIHFAGAALRALLLAGLTVSGYAQQATPAAEKPAAPPVQDGKPRFQVNFVNSCRPAADAAAEMRQLLEHLRTQPSFSGDFEIARGVTTLSETEARAAGASPEAAGKPSPWVRLRRDLPAKAVLSDAQYSLSLEESSVSEVLVLHLRNTDKAMQVVLSSSVTGTPEQVLHAQTPPDRIRIERYGKPSLILARCPADQSAYEPLFAMASDIFAMYRKSLKVERIVPGELDRLPGRKESKFPAGNQ